jgi:hypothetical protein
MMELDLGVSKLCYLEASKVRTPIGNLLGIDVRDPGDGKLGSLKGVLIEAAARRVRYFVVEAVGWWKTRCYLVAADDPIITVEPDRGALCVHSPVADLKGRGKCEFEIDSVRPYSDDDLIAAMFAQRAA